MLNRLDVYYVENIYYFDNNGICLSPFKDDLYVSMDDGNMYTIPAAMHGLRFFFNPNLNLIARNQKHHDTFYNMIDIPDSGFSMNGWKRRCALNFKPQTNA